MVAEDQELATDSTEMMIVCASIIAEREANRIDVNEMSAADDEMEAGVDVRDFHVLKMQLLYKKISLSLKNNN